MVDLPVEASCAVEGAGMRTHQGGTAQVITTKPLWSATPDRLD